MLSTPVPLPNLTRSGETTPTVHSLSPKSSEGSLKKEKINQTIVASKSVEDGLEDIDGGWEGYMETGLPEKGQRKLLRNLRHQILNVYRRLFSVVFLVNLGVLISVAVRGATTDYIGKVVIANIFVSVVIREEHVVNGLFFVFTAVPKSWPLRMRVFTARIYSLGGIHSGSAIAASMWLIYFTVQVSVDLRRHKASIPLAVITYIILAFLIIIISLAAPAWRRVHHDKFEMVHRFLGWTVTGLVWAQVVLLIRDYKDPSVPLHVAMRHSAPFWLVVILTASIASSWTHLRKVKVQSEVLSNHAVRIHYDYSSAIPGTFSRVSYSPLTEWHSFATISIPGQKGFDHIISRVGDWTSKTIANPPEEIWVRGVLIVGIMNVVPLFNRVVVVATGSVFANKTAIKLLWTSRNIRKTYGDRLVDSIMMAAPDAIVYDTDAHGKPDMVKLVHHVYKEFNAEAVCIISNQPLTQKVVYGLMARGVPAFGAIWDS
ncbi:hypothetical protein M407DRAFT_3699 [Tulasnella calospora MUT 4182]|uniref:Non-ribosomal peptide synthetase n=1 Tax=Tulasnella calospora MUT 4182 TaxID=1051891 RepID=A0A0C3QW35_9AGAM|nr:hypothetical protein M407DRAFT_3699 [Tulasnella calospora MUT 4182]